MERILTPPEELLGNRHQEDKVEVNPNLDPGRDVHMENELYFDMCGETSYGAAVATSKNEWNEDLGKNKDQKDLGITEIPEEDEENSDGWEIVWGDEEEVDSDDGFELI